MLHGRLRHAVAGLLAAALMLLGLPLLAATPAAAASSDVVLGGTVTATGGAPVADASVAVYRKSGVSLEYVSSAFSDSTGAWSLTTTGGGAFVVDVQATGYVRTWYGDAFDSTSATVVTLADGESATNLDVTLDAGRTMSGTIAIQGGSSPAGVLVSVYDVDRYDYYSATADAAGAWSVTNLPPGTFRVSFSGFDVNVVGETYDGFRPDEGYTPVTVGGSDVSGIDAVLLPGATLSGTLTGGGSPVEGLQVYAVDPTSSGIVAFATTDALGHWTISGLAAGSYTVRFEGSGYLTEYWDDHADAASADLVTLAMGGTSSGLDADLAVGATVTGRVTGGGVGVAAWVYAGGAFTVSDANGDYVLTGVRPGTVTVEAIPQDDRYLTTSSPAFSAADGVTYTRDIALSPAAVVTGLVLRVEDSSPVVGTSVAVFRQLPDGAYDYVDTTLTSATGSYRVGGLRPGDVARIETSDPTGEAAPATVTTSALLAGDNAYDLNLLIAARVQGTVKDASGVAIPDADVWLYGPSSSSTTSAADGTFAVKGLEPGTYDVFVTDPTGSHLSASLEAAVTATTGVVATIDVVMQDAAVVVGTVRDGAGSPVHGVDVEVFDPSSDGLVSSNARTAADGSFRVGRLPGGSYKLVVSSAGFCGLDEVCTRVVREYWQDSDSEAGATTLSLVAGTTTTVDPAVTRYSRLSGTVRADGQTVPGGYIEAFAVGTLIEDGAADESNIRNDGTFELSLPPGDYRLRVSAAGRPAFWFSSSEDRVRATIVQVQVETDQTGLDITAPTSGVLEGTVTVGGALLVDGGYVTAYGLRGQEVASSFVKDDGSYRIGGLPTGTYRLRVSTYSGAEVWVGGSSLDDATQVDVTDGATTTQDIAVPDPTAGSARLTLTVTDRAGAAAPDGQVVAYDDTFGYVTSCEVTGGACVLTVAAGTGYRLRYDPYSSALPSFWFGGPSFASATPIDLPAGADVALTLSGPETGSLVVVVSNDAAFGQPVEVSVSGAEGSGFDFFQVGPGISGSSSPIVLPVGTYDVVVRGTTSGEAVTAGATVVSGSTTTVELGLTSSTPEVSTGQGSISGTVRGDSGAALAGAAVCAFDIVYGEGCSDVVTTSADGTFVLSALRAGRYEVIVTGPVGYDRGITLVTVPSVGSVTADFQLTRPATVSGVVSGAAGPLADVVVTSTQSGYDRIVVTGVDGAWSMPASAGTLSVLADAQSLAYEPTWYPSSLDQAGASVVTVASGANVTGLDITLVGGRAPTRTTLVSSNSSPTVGAGVTITASVAPVKAGQPNATGTVQLWRNGDLVSTAALSAGSASFPVIVAGRLDTYEAVYSGSPSYAASTQLLDLTATGRTPSVSLAVPPTATAGQAVTLTATVTAAGAVPTGWITFTDYGTELRMVVVQPDGTAALVTTALGSGNHSIVARYWGDDITEPMSSAAQVMTVSAAAVTTGKIKGAVTSAGAPAPDVTVDLYQSVTGGGWAFLRTATTSATGAYGFGGLVAGDYEVRFSGADVVGNVSDVAGLTVGEVRDVSPNLLVPPGTVSGTVSRADDLSGVTDVRVELCNATGVCRTTRTGGTGAYSFAGVPAGSWSVRAVPADVDLIAASADVIVADAAVVADLSLAVLQAPPASVQVTTTAGTTDGGVPVVYWKDPTPLSFQACASGTATYTAVDESGATVASGNLMEGPSGVYTTTVPALAPVTGDVRFSLSVACPGGGTSTAAFDVYIDPSGVVVDAVGAPVEGATVVLSRFEPSTGTYEPVANGSDVMSPRNRTNPDLTDSQGRFGWDVTAGHYKVTASKTGCTTASTGDLEIPPPVTDIVLTLTCAPPPVPGAPTGVSATAGNAQASVSWTAPTAVPGAPVTDYEVAFSSNGGSSWTTFADSASTATGVTVTGLGNGTAYVFRVRAVSASAAGAWSTPSSAVTPSAPATVPSAPQGVVATGGVLSASVVWTAPASTGGSPVTSYTVTASNGAAQTVTGTSATFTLAADLYTFTVVATNGVGSSGPAVSNQVRVDGRTVVAPSLSFTGAAIPLSIVKPGFGWTAVVGSDPLAKIEVRVRSGATASPIGAFGGVITLPPTARSYAIPSPRPGTTYCVEVTAVDVNGLRSPSPVRCTAYVANDSVLTASSGWKSVAQKGAVSGQERRTTTKNATLVIAKATGKSLVLVVGKNAGAGSIGVYVGSTLKKTISLASSKTLTAQRISVSTGTLKGAKITIKVLKPGTKGVRIDGFAVLK